MIVWGSGRTVSLRNSMLSRWVKSDAITCTAVLPPFSGKSADSPLSPSLRDTYCAHKVAAVMTGHA